MDISASINSLIVGSSANINLATGSRIQQIEVTNRAAKLKIQPGVNVADIKLPANVDISAIVSNYEQVRNQIGNVNGTKPASPTVQPSPAVPQNPTPNPGTPAPQDQHQIRAHRSRRILHQIPAHRRRKTRHQIRVHRRRRTRRQIRAHRSRIMRLRL